MGVRGNPLMQELRGRLVEHQRGIDRYTEADEAGDLKDQPAPEAQPGAEAQQGEQREIEPVHRGGSLPAPVSALVGGVWGERVLPSLPSFIVTPRTPASEMDSVIADGANGSAAP